MTDIRKAVARAIVANIAMQDYIDDVVLVDDLKLAYLDQGEVDFGLVADAAIAAHIDAIMVPSEAVMDAAKREVIFFNDETDLNEWAETIWQAMLTAMRNEK